MKKPRCNVYAVELGPREVYVGATRKSVRQRFQEHKRGGMTSAGIVRRRGKRLRPDLVNGATCERCVARRLRKAGYKVHGASRKMAIRRR